MSIIIFTIEYRYRYKILLFQNFFVKNKKFIMYLLCMLFSQIWYTNITINSTKSIYKNYLAINELHFTTECILFSINIV